MQSREAAQLTPLGVDAALHTSQKPCGGGLALQGCAGGAVFYAADAACVGDIFDRFLFCRDLGPSIPHVSSGLWFFHRPAFAPWGRIVRFYIRETDVGNPAMFVVGIVRILGHLPLFWMVGANQIEHGFARISGSP